MALNSLATWEDNSFTSSLSQFSSDITEDWGTEVVAAVTAVLTPSLALIQFSSSLTSRIRRGGQGSSRA